MEHDPSAQDQSVRRDTDISFEDRARWAKLGRESLEAVPFPRALYDLVLPTLDTPQYGPYHNEGLLMDAHLGLILETINRVKEGSFDFGCLNLAAPFSNEVRHLIEEQIKSSGVDMLVYAYLHDLKKLDCMNIERVAGGEKKAEIYSKEEWEDLRKRYLGDEQAIRRHLKSEGVTKIGYRQDETLLGVEKEKDHGPEGGALLRELIEKDPETKEFFKGKEIILSGIENHEMHFQVFSQAKNAKQYEARLKDVFTQNEIDFILTVCFLDIAGSLDEKGNADFSGFKNMMEARACSFTIDKYAKERETQGKPLAENDLGSLKNLHGLNLLMARIEKMKAVPTTSLNTEERSSIDMRLDVWMEELKIDSGRKEEINEALSSENWAKELGSKKLGNLAGLIRNFLRESKK